MVDYMYRLPRTQVDEKLDDDELAAMGRLEKES